MLYAQTNIQLYKQLIEKEYSDDALSLIKKAYELSTHLFAGRFQYSGKDFISHCVGTASVLCFLDQPSEIIAAGMLHNAYGNGIFGFSTDDLEKKRNYIKKTLGKETEKYLYGFYCLNYNYKTNWRRTFLKNPESVNLLGETEKNSLVIQLADMLEHNIDSGTLYRSDYRSNFDFIKNKGSSMVKMAEILGYPVLAEELEKVFRETLLFKVNAVFQNKKYMEHSYVVIPKSYRKKFIVIFYEKFISFKKQNKPKFKKAKRQLIKLIRGPHLKKTV